MMLFERSGESAIISDAAAKPTAIMAVVAGSINAEKRYVYFSGLFLRLLIASRDHLNALCDLIAEQ